MKFIAIGLIAVCVLNSCRQTHSTQTLLTAENLPSQQFSISPGKDTTLQTLHGSKINILAGTFGGSALVSITVKEALTPAEILAAGLTTTSNGKPLRSAGMIYFNAAQDNKAADLQKPVKISLPNNYYDSAMQVFKGEETAEGINWVDPQPVDTPIQKLRWDHGKAVFQNNCRSCHGITKRLTGSALADVFTNPVYTNNKKRLYHFIRNAPVVQATDPYYARMKVRYGGSSMTAFPALKDLELDNLFYYIRTEATRTGFFNKIKPLWDIDTSVKTEPPCQVYDTTYYPNPDFSESYLGTDAVSPVTPEEQDTLTNDLTTDDFTRPDYTAGMYDFSIRSNGWYNIDAFLKDEPNTLNIVLKVVLNNEPDVMDVVAFFPNRKILFQAEGKHNGYYSFQSGDSALHLYRDDRFVIFAHGSKKDKLYYGITTGYVQTVSGDQRVEVTIRESTEAEVKKALLSQRLDGIELNVEKKLMSVLPRPCNEAKPAVPATDTVSAK